MTLTIENLPSELVMRLQAAPQDMEKARRLLLLAFDAEVSLPSPLNKDELKQLSPAEHEGIQAGLKDVDAGRAHSHETVFARLRDLAK